MEASNSPPRLLRSLSKRVSQRRLYPNLRQLLVPLKSSQKNLCKAIPRQLIPPQKLLPVSPPPFGSHLLRCEHANSTLHFPCFALDTTLNAGLLS